MTASLEFLIFRGAQQSHARGAEGHHGATTSVTPPATTAVSESDVIPKFRVDTEAHAQLAQRAPTSQHHGVSPDRHAPVRRVFLCGVEQRPRKGLNEKPDCAVITARAGELTES